MTVLFMHIPKTAGTSVIDDFTSLVGELNAQNGLSGKRAIWDTMTFSLFNSGHLFLAECQRLMQGRYACLATVFRDPVERLASHIRYQDQFNQPEFRYLYDGWPKYIQESTKRLNSTDFSSAASLNDFLSTLSPWETLTFDNAQVRYLIEDPGEGLDRYKACLDDNDGDLAIRNLSCFDAIGTPKILNSFMKNVSFLAGLPTPERVPHLNRSSCRRSINITDGEILSVLRSRTIQDQRLYDAVERHLVGTLAGC